MAVVANAPSSELSPVKQALLEIRVLRARLDQVHQRAHEPIAIVGMGVRFPGGADDPESFWQLMRNGVDAITEVPRDRWDIDAIYDRDTLKPGKMSTRYGGWLDNVYDFSPAFFGISPREAISMDPQHRLLLEVTWEALEHAGYASRGLFGTNGSVFVGITNSDHLGMLLSDPERIDAYVSTGNASSIAAGRLAYFLGLRGPAMALDTACSSSLVAVHLACQSLRRRETDLALAGGVSLILSPEITINFSKAGMMAPDGRCKTFDAAADGYVRSEGCAMLVLRRLSDALDGHDNILAVIRGTAVNQDGRSGGLTAPNGPSQQDVIRAALADAEVDVKDIDYVEAHGTGTSLGDPIEVGAIEAVLCADRPAAQPLLLGSVKTNIGHTEAAAGVAGLAKVVLALQHREIPPHLHLHTPNPHLRLAPRVPIEIPTRARTWQSATGRRRLAGLSSFGLSGTNAHVVLEEAPTRSSLVAPAQPLHMLPLSARSAPELKVVAARYANTLQNGFDSPAELADLCYSAAAGRDHFEHRLVLTGRSAHALAERLTAVAAPSGDTAQVIRGSFDGTTLPEVAFLFSGHGSSYIDMGRRLYDTQPVFRSTLDYCAAVLAPRLEHALLAALFPDRFPEVPDAAGLAGQMVYAQPALFALQVSLGELWRAWGIRPSVVMGHSAGEYAAACVAGILSIDDGLKLAAARGELLHSLAAAGQMLSFRASEARVAAAVARYPAAVSIAAINGPESTVISGTIEATQAIAVELAAEGVEWRKLAIATASHSPLVEPILDAFERVAMSISYARPSIPLVSTLTGRLIAGGEATSGAYWRDHLRGPVRFSAAVDTLVEQGAQVFVEIGPQASLLGMAARCVPQDFGTWLPSLRPERDENEQLLESLGTLYVNGADVDWTGFHRAAGPRQRVPLPTYPWRRDSYAMDIVTAAGQGPRALEADRWAAVGQAALRQAEQGPLDLATEAYPARWSALDQLTTAYIVHTLRSTWGLFGIPGERHTVDDVLRTCGIAPIYRQLVARWLGHLADDGLLTRGHGPAGASVFVASQPLEVPSLTDGDLVQARAALADLPLLLGYVQRCGEGLAQVLTGRQSPLETLFPGGAYTFVEFLYRDWAVARYFNSIAGATVASVASHHRRLPLRVLEIGAGSGGTTAALLPALKRHDAHYTFTDTSDFFLSRAAARFGTEFPSVQYALLDIERDPLTQGYPANGFDVVVAANVLHATANLDRTLQHVRAVLAPGGILVLLEATSHPRWLDATTGLIAGWQKFEDQWRADNPLLSASRWQLALRSAGFEDAVAVPGDESPAAVLRQHIVIALAPTEGGTRSQSPVAWPTHVAHVAGVLEDEHGDAESIRLMHSLQDATLAERRELMVDYVRGHVARVLRVAAPKELGRDRRLMDLGLDSLMAVELRNRLATALDLKHKLPASLIFDYPTIGAVAGFLEPLVAATVTRPEPNGEAAGAELNGSPKEAQMGASDIAALSDAEVEQLLLKKLELL